MKSEELVEVLKRSKVEILNVDSFCELVDDTSILERNIHFKVGCDHYSIEWYKNLMTLKIPLITSFEVKFDSIEHSSTWPNGYMRNLQMRYGGECVCIIGLEKYPTRDENEKI